MIETKSDLKSLKVTQFGRRDVRMVSALDSASSLDKAHTHTHSDKWVQMANEPCDGLAFHAGVSESTPSHGPDGPAIAQLVSLRMLCVKTVKISLMF